MNKPQGVNVGAAVIKFSSTNQRNESNLFQIMLQGKHLVPRHKFAATFATFANDYVNRWNLHLTILLWTNNRQQPQKQATE